jgi:ABC-type nickel/cobalt efflux system permease component RcnA
MEMGYLIIFWYGILHAFGPDHLTAIADFSIGKSMKKTMLITIMFAFGHGLMLFIFAKILEVYELPESITAYGDAISSSVIIAMGLYLLFMVATDKIQLNRHIHDNKEHIHIYFGKEHSHDSAASSTASAWGIGALMGIGGVRGMLVTLGMLQGQSVEWTMVLAFVAGVSLVFLSFGASILYLNRQYLTNITNVRRVFAAAGFISVAVGTNMLLA